MNGVLVVDKPQGLTSHDVVAVARRRLREQRIGHTGTLDPLATGVLPLACGTATRLVRFLTASEKEYQAVIRFGVTTDTYDVTGVETGRSDRCPSRDAVEEGLRALTGSYLQTPPAYSAKKVDGRRAYELARRDETVVLEPVPVRVAFATVTAFDGATASVTLVCSAGFYVRSFAHTLGERVGTGACLEALRRTRAGEFSLDSAVTLEALQGQEDVLPRVIPLDRLLDTFPAAHLTPEGARRVGHGRDVEAAHVEAAPGQRGPWVRLIDSEGRLLALAEPAGTALHPSVVLI